MITVKRKKVTVICFVWLGQLQGLFWTCRNWSYDMVSIGLWDHLREVYQWNPILFTGLAKGNIGFHFLLCMLMVQHSSDHSSCHLIICFIILFLLPCILLFTMIAKIKHKELRNLQHCIARINKVGIFVLYTHNVERSDSILSSILKISRHH